MLDEPLSPLPQMPRMETIDRGLLVRAPAKVNLDLRVGPRRPDGFHSLCSHVVKVTLFDTLTLRPRQDARLTLTCQGADCGPDADNLAMRAAVAMARRAGDAAGGVDIELGKLIPPGKGLGGGSSDAAAVLTGLNALWKLALSDAELSLLGAQLGSDVPLFLGPPAARMAGRGEIIAPVGVYPFAAVIVMTDAHCATGEVYRAFDEMVAAEEIEAWDGGSIGEYDSIELGLHRPSRWRDLLRNDLAAPAERVCPALAAAWDALTQFTDAPVLMTGSGSGLFVLLDEPAEAAGVVANMPPELAARSIIVQPSDW